ncbi:MAG: class I SAM-dependent methyltransferase [Terracidiphilus sp.]
MTDSVFREYGRYYDLLYREKDYLVEIAYVHDLLVRFGVPAGEILELGSGTGRHGRLLAKAGYTVFGLERSETMIALARAGAETPGFTCQRGDIRSARLQRQFDAVISLFHVISYQVSDEDLLGTFRTAREHVAVGALFIFDFWYGPAVIAQKPSVREKIFEDEHLTVRRRSEPSWDMSQNRVDVHFRVAITDKTEGRSYDLDEIHPMRYFFLPELEIIGQETGFAFVAAEEFVTGAPPSTETWGVCAVLRAV